MTSYFKNICKILTLSFIPFCLLCKEQNQSGRVPLKCLILICQNEDLLEKVNVLLITHKKLVE